MADIEIMQADADALIAMEKQRVDDKQWLFPAEGGRLAIPLASSDNRENFMLDVTRGRIKFRKASYQSRARQAIVLMRLCLDGAPHRNPDGQELACPHLHIYREGYGDKWAFQHRLTSTRQLRTFSPRSKPSCGIVMSLCHPTFKRDCSHDRCC